MEKTVKVEFVEQSKLVTTNVKVEYKGEGEDLNSLALEEAKELFSKAFNFSKLKTMEKMR